MISQLIKKERSEIYILHFMHAILFGVAQIYMFYLEESLLSLSTLWFLVLAGTFENFHYRALRDLNYTYWTLTIIKILWICFSLLGTTHLFNDFTFALFCIFIVIAISSEIYLMSSPIYYPRVQWWEYDFRYRGDLKIKIEYKHQDFKARLADLRREAGCVISFEEMGLGESFLIKSYLQDEEIPFEAKIVSMRENIPGRGYRYGVQFILSETDIKNFKRYKDFYQTRYKVKRRNKFA